MKLINKANKKRYVLLAAAAGISCYLSVYVVCIGNTFSMSTADYAQQAQRIVDCSVCSADSNKK